MYMFTPCEQSPYLLGGFSEYCYVFPTKALQFLDHNRDRFRFEAMLSNRYSLEQINEAMAAMHGFREVKPVIVFG